MRIEWQVEISQKDYKVISIPQFSHKEYVFPRQDPC
jgi:hypothetical protein